LSNRCLRAIAWALGTPLSLAVASALGACKSEKRAPQPVPLFPLELARATRVGAAAVVDHERAAPWASACQIHHDCPPADLLTHCASGLNALDADRIGSASPLEPGARIAVRGALQVGIAERATIKCKDDCCQNSVSLSAFVSHGSAAVVLAGLGCGGDDSRTCCGVPAFGQTVVAVGTLARPSPEFASFGVYWSLDAAVLCTEQ
jgi:hypothetical protein